MPPIGRTTVAEDIEAELHAIKTLLQTLGPLKPVEHSASERQAFITQDDIQKYFVQGQYPMPGSKSQALVNAKNAGYLDAIEPGKYRLNSVGYNLVAHKMPKDGSAQSKPRRKAAKKVARKSAKKGKK